ncbi:unnamed protein product [Schistosoma turkestanicum]|nr:unnamed protein product [Schistosoma turkestanicum]
MTSMSRVVPSIPLMESSKCKVNKLKEADRLMIVSEYTKTVLMLAIIQIFITFCVVIIASKIILRIQFKTKLDFTVQLIVAGLYVLVAFLMVLLIGVAKNISESYPLNVVFVIFYSIFMSTALGFSITKPCIPLTFGVFVISLIIFISALLIGAAIKAQLVDYSAAILISFSFLSLVILTVFTVFNVWKHKDVGIGVDIGAEILLFFITIFVSHLTVGKSRYFIFHPNFALASIFLYTTFFATLSVNIDVSKHFLNKTSTLCTEST